MKLRLSQSVRALLRPHLGWYGLLAAAGLTWFGLVAIHTAAPVHAMDQLRWVPIALIMMVAVCLPLPRLIGLSSYVLLAICVALLVYMLIPSAPMVPRVNGATSWIRLQLGGHTISVQPAELAKVAFVLSIAWYLRYRDSYRNLKGMLVPFGIMLLPVALIIRQPDLGTAVVFAPTLFVMLVAAGAKLRHLGTLLGVAAMVVAVNIALIYVLPAGVNHPFLRPHQENRIRSTVSLAQGEDRYLQDLAHQQYKAMNLIGSGGFLGYGEERSRTIVKFNHVPHNYNDMIFAVIVNRWGFVGGAVTIALYLLLLLSFVLVAARSKDPFARLATVGFGGLIFSQAAINMGMTLGLLPVTGINLPFVSYGGTSLVTLFIMVGLVLNFASRRPAPLSRPSFEYDPVDLIFQ